MVRFSNGFYIFPDSYFKSMRKQDLINYIRTIEKNWENQLITNDIQYNNCKRLLAEERNKAIEEFAERLKGKAERESIGTHFPDGLYGEVVEVGKLKNMIDEIAEEMRGAE